MNVFARNWLNETLQEKNDSVSKKIPLYHPCISSSQWELWIGLGPPVGWVKKVRHNFPRFKPGNDTYPFEKCMSGPWKALWHWMNISLSLNRKVVNHSVMSYPFPFLKLNIRTLHLQIYWCILDTIYSTSSAVPFFFSNSAIGKFNAKSTI